MSSLYRLPDVTEVRNPELRQLVPAYADREVEPELLLVDVELLDGLLLCDGL